MKITWFFLSYKIIRWVPSLRFHACNYDMVGRALSITSFRAWVQTWPIFYACKWWPLLLFHTEQNLWPPLFTPVTTISCLGFRLLLMIIDRHWLSLHQMRNQAVELELANHRTWPELPVRARSSLTSSCSLILPARWVTSWQTRWPCVRKFTAPCNHLLCSKCTMLDFLLHLESAALYCKCAINIHEGIYMHFEATQPGIYIAQTKKYGSLPSYNDFPKAFQETLLPF